MNIKEILSEMADYLKASAGDKWDEVKGQAEDYLKETEQRLLLVTTEAATGNLSADFLVERAKDELKILESQAISLGIMAASFSQELVSSVIQKILVTIIQILTSAIK